MFKKKDDEKITLTKEELRQNFMEVLNNPFGDDKDIPEENKVSMKIGVMLNGVLILQQLEKKLFGEENGNN